MDRGFQNGLGILEDLKEKVDDVGDAGITLGENKGTTESADEGGAADTSDSGERASDDSYSLGSFFSDLESFGDDAAEKLEESKKFFTKLGAVVAIIGTCINTGTTLANSIDDGEVKTAIIHGFLLIVIQIPTTLAMLFVFLKDWAVMTVTGILKAKEELEELVSDIDSFVDDTESDEDGKDDSTTPKPFNGKMKAETEILKSDLEMTKVKNNYNSLDELQKSDSNECKRDGDKKFLENPNSYSEPHGGKVISENVPSDANLDRNILCRMEEGTQKTKSAKHQRPTSSQKVQKGESQRLTMIQKERKSGGTYQSAPSHHRSSKMKPHRVSKSHTTSRPGKHRETVGVSRGKTAPHKTSSKSKAETGQRQGAVSSQRHGGTPSTKKASLQTKKKSKSKPIGRDHGSKTEAEEANPKDNTAYKKQSRLHEPQDKDELVESDKGKTWNSWWKKKDEK